MGEQAHSQLGFQLWHLRFPKHESEVFDPGSGFDRPFAGLRYAALTARGSAGTRAEHITDLLNFSRRTHANKVDTALRLRAGSLAHASAGSARRTALRPIKMGELLHSSYAKCLVSLVRARLRPVTVDMQQLERQPARCLRGVGTLDGHPGAPHCRWQPGTDGVGRSRPCEHDAKPSSATFSEACAWTDWQHQQDSTTQLSSGSSLGTNLDAEQGDVGNFVERTGPRHRTSGGPSLSSPRPPSSPRTCPMSGTLTMDRRQSVPPSLTLGYAPWTRPFSLSAQRAAPSRRATPRAQHASVPTRAAS